jgi:polar amino acid transport system permease protein
MVSFDFVAVLQQWPLLARGVAWTVGLTALSAVLGVALGVGCAWARLEGPALLRRVTGVYVELIRNTPFIVQLFFVFFGLPAAWAEAVAGMGLGDRDGVNLGAYAAEIVRAGIEARRAARSRRRAAWR